MNLAVIQKFSLHFLGSHIIASPLHSVVNGIHDNVVHQGIYLFFSIAFHLHGCLILVFLYDALFCTELAN